MIAERFKFHGRYQREGESVTRYIVELKKLAATCEFGTFLSESLRDRFVYGLRDGATQKKLLSVADLTFKRASEIAQAMEIAEKNTQEFRPGSHSEVKKISRMTVRGDKGKLNKPQGGKIPQGIADKPTTSYRCAGSHAPNLRKFKEEKCYACSKKGHIAKVCRSKKASKTSLKYVAQEDLAPRVYDLAEEELGLYCVYTKPKVKKYTAKIQIDQEYVDMEIDTGAAVSIIPEGLYSAQLSHHPLAKSKVVLKTYSPSSR